MLQKGLLLDLIISDFDWTSGVFVVQNPKIGRVFQAYVRTWMNDLIESGVHLTCGMKLLIVDQTSTTVSLYEWATSCQCPKHDSRLIDLFYWKNPGCWLDVLCWFFSKKKPLSEYMYIYNQISNIRRALVGNKIVDHSDVVGASPVGAAPTTSSFST